ncbi:Oidioi.mRNA.OKI2018_I69.XSR.g14240.t1.cds [Oikopleura dioica]|uniref:Oidioi.mRNA.OKI2018_I69.XSR.g14240.t1.cds n=1 Tax=Oikopleura dioica TaxID=34765 RepID=A0ABN7SB03_OIKDI|nr:Oidioi.mRNA.OKI2018_I69.XSR.g14240.t1.cds [Oikopleura dioica]
MFYTRILSEKLPKDLAGNTLVKRKNFFDTVERCKLCGTGISYKNVQLISQFVSPYTGRLYTENATGLCPSKYDELKTSYEIAQSLLLIGPSKEPLFMNDPIGPTELNAFKSHSDKSEKTGIKESKDRSLAESEEAEEKLLSEVETKWIDKNQITSLFAESADFEEDINLQTSKERPTPTTENSAKESDKIFKN